MMSSRGASLLKAASWLRLTLARRTKSVLGWLVFHLGLHRVLLPDRAVVVVFHRVDNRYPGNLITITGPQFERFVAFFSRFFRIVSVGALLDALCRQQPLRGLLAVTFDDAYVDNAVVAAPLLARYRVRACFFVPTELVGSEVQAHWDRSWGIRSQWMTWDQIRALRAAGHEIGAHTMTHPDLATLEATQARAEIRGARERLERELGEPVKFFAYPYGRRGAITEEVRRIVQEEGFTCCFGAHGGTVERTADLYALPRIAVSPWFRSPYQFGYELITGRLRSDDGTVVT